MIHIVSSAGELSSPVDTFDSSFLDNLQNTRTTEVQLQLLKPHYAGSEIAPSWSPMRPKIQFWRLVKLVVIVDFHVRRK